MTEIIFFITQVIISGLVLGCIYALGAIGITLIFGILRFAHFAHSELMTGGAFIAFLLASAFAAWGIVTPIPTGFGWSRCCCGAATRSANWPRRAESQATWHRNTCG